MKTITVTDPKEENPPSKSNLSPINLGASDEIHSVVTHTPLERRAELFVESRKDVGSFVREDVTAVLKRVVLSDADDSIYTMLCNDGGTFRGEDVLYLDT